MISISTSYIVSAILVACVFAVSLLLGFALNGKSRRTRLFFNLTGLFFAAIAILEKLGWSAHPWSAGSPAQALNDLYFRICFLLGTGLWFVSWTMAFLESRPRRSAKKLEPIAVEHQFSDI